MLLKLDPQGYPQNLVVSYGRQTLVHKWDCKYGVCYLWTFLWKTIVIGTFNTVPINFTLPLNNFNILNGKIRWQVRGSPITPGRINWLTPPIHHKWNFANDNQKGIPTSRSTMPESISGYVPRWLRRFLHALSLIGRPLSFWWWCVVESLPPCRLRYSIHPIPHLIFRLFQQQPLRGSHQTPLIG